MTVAPNVDAAEIAKFEALAHRWWDPDGDFKALHDINPLRVDYVNERCELSGAPVIDVGCGGGILTESLAALGADVTGVDVAGGRLRSRGCTRSSPASRTTSAISRPRRRNSPKKSPGRSRL